jgi:Zn-dependent peptidase ImmA (M78 family)/DNA-binding XRE family transcriptional regulator
MDQKQLAARIAEARTSKGWSQEELAKTLRMDRTSVVKIEQGRRRVTALELADLARELGRRIEWFLSTPPAAIAQHRGRVGDGAVQRPIDLELEALGADVDLLIDLDRLALAERPAVLERPVSMAGAEALGQEIRQMAGDDGGPVPDLVEICEGVGLEAFGLDLGHDEADAASMVQGSHGVALVNSDRALGRRRLALAHELVHYMIDDQYQADFRIDAPKDDHYEALVDRAARALLMPADDLAAAWADTVGGGVRGAAVRAGHRYRVDMATLARRLVEIGNIDSKTASEIRGTRTTKGDIVGLGLYVPHDLEGVSLPPAYARAVLKAYDAEDITIERALDLMRGTFAADDFTPRSALSADSLWGAIS